MTISKHAAAVVAGRAATVLLAALLAAGCAPKTGIVSGKVTFQEKPITFGSVSFLAEDGKAVSAAIEQDGHYTVPNVPLGPAQVAVIALPPPPPVIRPDAPPGSVTLPPPMPHVPDRYKEAKQSGLTYTVQPGEQVFDIKLQP